jgi:2-polyprenyl-3-methyl-5-hydroxy-6-metoxy-1,4-benzoquinol methylase
MKKLYDNYLDSHFIKLNSAKNQFSPATVKLYNKWYKKFLPPVKTAKILDLGCGMGHFLYFLKEEGYTNFTGIDLSKQQVDYVKKNLTNNVFAADAFDFLKTAGGFDLIVIHDVIEHIAKDRLFDFLRLVSASLKGGGKIFIRTDNMANPFSLKSRYIDITHEIGFTEYSLDAVLTTAGFRNIELFPAGSLSDSFVSFWQSIAARGIYAVMRLLFKIQSYPAPKILTPNIIAVASKP